MGEGISFDGRRFEKNRTMWGEGGESAPMSPTMGNPVFQAL